MVRNSRRTARESYPLGLDLEQLGAIFRARRAELELSQATVGARIDMSDREIANLELARQMPSLVVFVNACRAYSLDPATVLRTITTEEAQKEE